MMLFGPPKLLNIIATRLHFFVRLQLQLLLFATLFVTVLYRFAAAAALQECCLQTLYRLH
jgi:hypothetical protein